MTIKRRALTLAVALAMLLCFGAPSAPAASWPQIDSVDGDVQDVDSSRILFREFLDSDGGYGATGPLSIKDRRSEAITQITSVPGKPHRGHLTAYGALVETLNEGRQELYDWRAGAAVDLGRAWTVKVAGAYAAWKHEGNLFRRDLAAGTMTKISSFAKTWDVADNGDVVFTNDADGTPADSLWRYRGGTTALLAAGTATTRHASPRTDGINVVWKQTTNSETSLQGHGPGGAFALANTTPAGDYEVVDGWIAFTRGSSSSSVWTRDPLGVETSAGGTDPATLGTLGEDGEVLFNGAGGELFLARPGEATLSLGLIGSGDGARFMDGRWYSIGNQLHRLSVTDAPSDGSETQIGSAPQGTVTSTDADFTFSSTAAGSPTFECRLDGASWAPCTSPRHLAGLGQGRHTFLVRSVEGGEVDPDPAAQVWAVDTATPVVTLDVPTVEGSTNDSTPLFSGSAGQLAGDDDHVTVEIFAGSAATGTPLHTFDTPRHVDTHGSQGFWSAPAPQALADGVYTARAHQSDDASHTDYSDAKTFRVDTVAPEPFDLLTPADGGYWRASEPGVTWEPAVDAGSGIDHYEVKLVGVEGTFRAEPQTACDADRCALTQGLHPPPGTTTWHVTAYDVVGHKRVSASRTFTVDDSAPGEFALVAPTDGAHTADTTPTLSWQAATDAESGIDHYEVWLDGARVATDVHGTEFTPPSELAGGAHTWRIDAVNGGDGTRSSASRGFVVDLTAPAAALSAAPDRVLEGDGVTLDASGSSDADQGSIARYEWDIDGDGSFERDTGAASTTTATYSAAGEMHPAVRVTDSVGLTAVRAVVVSVRPRPPAGPAGVSINGGDRFTNDPDVQVDVVWPPLSSGLLIANDGGFGAAETRPLATPVAWTLDSSGSERLPRTIYVRFTGDDRRETYQDDIILDETPPALLSARLSGGKLRLRARDNVSGVRAMQITTNRSRAVRARRFRRVVRVHSRFAYTRVRDGAGNWSRWKRVVRRRSR